MVNRSRRDCPICGKRGLLKLSNHLSRVHGLSSEERQPWLQRASHLPPLVDLPVNLPPSSCPVIAMPSNNSPVHSLATQGYPEFTFQHPYSMMVVGPSQCGKTHFVHQLLTHKCIDYPDKKPVLVVWYYNQWQPKYEEIQRDLKNKIRFVQGLPELEDDLSTIKTSRHTIIVLDDLMAQATDSPVVSKLFTQGRHRNASVILLLQNMFPKGKYNTDISRNATYKVLFRSPGDRKQIDIMAEQTFAKARPRFMQAYHQETDRPYGYIVVDNHPRTTSEHQVVGNVFGDCYTYPHITASHPRVEFPRESLPLPEQQEPATTRKRRAPFIKKSEVQTSKKRKAVHRRVPTKKRMLQNKSKSQKQTRKQPVHYSSEEDVPEEEEGGDEESTSEEEEEDSEISYTEGEEVDDEPVHEEQPDWMNPYWGNSGEDVEEENQYGGGIWHYPGFRYYHPSRGGGGRTVYE